jgi:uncharacterized protein
MLENLFVALAVAWVAALYASVGHGGASGYLAVMALLSFSPPVMKPGALLLNLLVAGIGAVQFWRAGHFRFSLLWPFAAASIPLSYVGARLTIPPSVYGGLLCLTLVWAGARMAFLRGAAAGDEVPVRPKWRWSLPVGAAVGFLSGIVGVGGGIFLSPLFIFLRWATPKETAAVSAAFIWLNSAAGMFGHLHSGVRLPDNLVLWVPAAALGGAVGAFYGAQRWSSLTLRRLLAVVLMIAAVKALVTFYG